MRLLEQTHSTTPITEFITRNIAAAGTIGRKGYAEDFLAASPFLPLVNLFK